MQEANQRMELDELVKLLPEEGQATIIKLASQGDGLLQGAGFGGGMINSFWHDCIKGEIVRFLVRTGKAEHEGYQNKISDFYIDDRCGRAPRGQLNALRDELKLAINDDYKPCAICGKPTDKTVIEQHDDRHESTKEWELSEKRMANRGVSKTSPCCYYCYQNKLIVQRKA